MNNAPIPNQPQNVRSVTTGKLELRKLWSVPQAEFIYALFVEVKVETCEMEEETHKNVNGKEVITQVPNWDKIISTETDWRTPQGYVGDEAWAKKTAEHFEIAFPKEEYKADDSEKEA